MDFRKSITGLSLIVEQTLGLNPFDVALYVFINRRRDKIKILLWEKNGFVLWYKRLEKQTKNSDATERHRIRQTKSKATLKKFHQ
ncbi:MAG: IS66 family insertion sequence element accessory protein TnpB [Candidatus Thiodiazotropha endolucinida]|nr:IS66 family insertion sequence element accessory protein TnpB [Candidatus Thiodiazotropha taylori]MCG8042330.1 IS66 family insertion sequence element accessory protein TnpB [Candidatus Thiodiazotropha taylori]MCG8100840.1 IS66 family insertion sequence element accessory protein TnpB [Candidatus Thiodiazotropha taylori]MCG8122192.1 IS66 family insertion sequence element accessory protein TnpB [Candidatus Thiodiazotropha taylori]